MFGLNQKKSYIYTICLRAIRKILSNNFGSYYIIVARNQRGDYFCSASSRLLASAIIEIINCMPTIKVCYTRE